MIGQQSFQVVLHKGVQDSVKRGYAAGNQQDDTPAPVGFTDQIETQSDKPVNGHLEHNARHQGRCM